MATSKNQAAGAAGQAATRMHALRQMPSPWGYAQIADAAGVDIETARRWAHDGRKNRDEKIAEHYGVTLRTVRGWRKNGTWREKATAAKLEHHGVGYHALPEATHRLGGSDGWDRDLILAWLQTAFDSTGRTRLDSKTGEARQLVPTGRPPGIVETAPRAPRRPGREAERDKVIREYVKRVKAGETDTQARGGIADKFGIARKQVSRYLVEGRSMPDKYGDIPAGSPARGPRKQQEPAKATRRERTAPTAARPRKSAGRRALTA